MIGLGVLFAWRRSHGAPRAPAPSGLRCCPFQNLGDSTDDYFADGITDEVRGKLAALPGLQVIASSSSSQYRKTTKSPQVIAKELGVDYLLLGKVRWERPRRQSRVRVSPELIKVTGGAAATTKWRAVRRRPSPTSSRCRPTSPAAWRRRSTWRSRTALNSNSRRKPTRNLAAYDAYLKGVEALVNGGNPVAIRHALDQFERAVALDTSFAQAWAKLSDVASLLAVTTVPTQA